MPDGSSLHVVLGAAGGIGGAVTRELAGRGHSVRAVTRDGSADLPDGISRVAADLTTAAGAAVACSGAAVVYHCAQPPYGTRSWAEGFPDLNASIIDATERADAKLVVADNLYMYGPLAGPISETTSQRPSSAKGRIRKDLSETLLAAHAAGRVRVTIGRASDYFGPAGSHSIAGLLFAGILAGKSVRWPADGDQPHSFAYLPDIARALVVLGARTDADGRAWVLPEAPPLTAREFVALIERESGEPAKLAITSKLAMRVAGLFVPEAREIPDLWYQFEAPFVADARAFLATFDPFAVTPLDQAVRETVSWYRTALASVEWSSAGPAVRGLPGTPQEAAGDGSLRQPPRRR